ncbi:MAG: hypothetical protein JWN26_819 [Candidatus Saccharibacteria bacterium]|nr:hypothetical protein [Candidatus Saccharibacteria bacterium]
MTEQRLPTLNGDDGAWGSILNQFLAKEHYNTGIDNPLNGGHSTITVRAGSATAGTSPIKLTSGPILTTPEAGAIEFTTDKLYFTQTTGTARRVISTYDDSLGATGAISRLISTIVTNTTAGSATNTDYVYLVSGTTTVTLPTAVANTNIYTVTNTGTNTVTVATTSSQTINGSNSVTIPLTNMSLDFVSTNSNWTIK